MSSLSNLYENTVLDAILATTPMTQPTSATVALFTSPVSVEATTALLEAGSFANEVAGTGYARTAVTFAASVDGVATSNANVTFNTAGSDWGLISHLAVVDNLGQIIVHGVLDVAKEILWGDTMEFTAGNITVTLA